MTRQQRYQKKIRNAFRGFVNRLVNVKAANVNLNLNRQYGESSSSATGVDNIRTHREGGTVVHVPRNNNSVVPPPENDVPIPRASPISQQETMKQQSQAPTSLHTTATVPTNISLRSSLGVEDLEENSRNDIAVSPSYSSSVSSTNISTGENKSESSHSHIYGEAIPTLKAACEKGTFPPSSCNNSQGSSSSSFPTIEKLCREGLLTTLVRQSPQSSISSQNHSINFDFEKTSTMSFDDDDDDNLSTGTSHYSFLSESTMSDEENLISEKWLQDAKDIVQKYRSF